MTDICRHSAKRLKQEEFAHRHDEALNKTRQEAGEPNRNSSKKQQRITNSKTFAVQPTSRFSKVFPYFRQPKEVGYFSQDTKRIFKDDSSRLRCFSPPPNCDDVSFDLSAGYDIFMGRDESVKAYINDLLRWILLHKNAFSLHGETSSTSVDR